MRKLLELDDTMKKSIVNYYREGIIEKVIVLFIRSSETSYIGVSLLKPRIEDYKYIERKFTGLKSSFILKY